MTDTAEDQNQKKTSQTLQPGPQSPASGGGAVHLSPSASVPAGSTGTSSPSSPANSGGQFASLNQYLTANADKAQPLANQVTSGIGKQYQGLEQGNQQALSNINKQVSANPTDPNAAKTMADESANPASFTKDPNNVASFQKLLNASYTGPQSAEGTSDFTNQQATINKAISEGQTQLGSEAGRKNLLRANEANPTSGVTALNSAILSKSPEALASVQNAYKPFQNLLTGLQGGATEANKAIAQQQTTAKNTADTAAKQVAQQREQLTQNVNKQLAKQQADYKAYTDTSSGIGAALQGGTLPTSYGADPNLTAFMTNQISPWMTANAPNIKPTYNFANAMPDIPVATAPSLNTAVTQQDLDTANALQALTGTAPMTSIAGITKPENYALSATPTVNNSALAGDIAAGFTGGTNAVNVSRPAFDQYNTLLAQLSNYQGKWTPQYGKEPDKMSPQWGQWAYYHGGPGTSGLQSTSLPPQQTA